MTFSRIGLGICKSVLVAGMIGILLYELYSYISLQRCLVGCIRLRGNIYLAARINEPFTMGVLSPKIYLPSSVEEERYEYVIAHEEVHIARKDALTRCVGSVLRTVFWFQPLMWVAYYLFINDMEDACDEAALRKRSMEYRIQYAEALVEVSYQDGKAGSVAIGYGSGEIKKRIKHVLEYKKPK
ncbi:MAG: M56 family metallopeptidase, partial [Lachnospiraceae bacterium]